MHPEVDDPMVLLSQYYPVGTMCHFPPQQTGASKRRRGRRKGKGGGDEDDAAGRTRKRKLLSEEQLSMLERSFGNEHKLETGRKNRLAAELGLHPRQVAVWFQNRRARWKSKKIQEAYSKLLSEHNNIVLEKGVLEAELIVLKEQLQKAQKDIQRLLDHQHDLTTNGSISTPLSMDTTGVVDPCFFGEFTPDEALENAFYMPWTCNYIDLELGHNFYLM